MAADWGNRLLILARGALPRETGVTHVTTRNRNPGYVSEKPVVTPVTPVTSLKAALPNEGQTDGVTNGVTIPDGPAERAAIIEFETCVPRTWAEGFAGLDRQRPLAGYSETHGARSSTMLAASSIAGAPRPPALPGTLPTCLGSTRARGATATTLWG